MDERLHKINEMIDKGIDEIVSKGVFNKETACLAGDLVDMRKDIVTIEAMGESGYSGYRPHWDDGMSYARRDGDGDGRYYESRRRYNSYGGSYNDGSYARRNSYERGYSGRDQMVEHLEMAMQQATNDQEREAIRRLISG